jgi:hypothetical protein
MEGNYVRPLHWLVHHWLGLPPYPGYLKIPTHCVEILRKPGFGGRAGVTHRAVMQGLGLVRYTRATHKTSGLSQNFNALR